MGSQLVTALIEQRAVQKTNPDEISPEVSNPITQEPFYKLSTFTPIEQDGGVGSSQFSKPIEQVSLKRLNPVDEVIEQASVSTDNNELLIEQVKLSSNSATSKPIEQKNVQSPSTGSHPIEQTEVITNTVDIEQFDFIDLIFPACGSIRNPVSTNILWRLVDTGFPFDVDTLIFKVNGLEVQDSSSFSVTALINGIQIDYDPPEYFDYNTEVPVYLEIFDTDTIPNKLVIFCSFFTTIDSAGPQIVNFTLCGQDSVASDADVEFDIIDFQTGVERSSIELSIEGIGICDGLELDPITTNSGSGYHVLWSHPNSPFRYGSTVTAAVAAQDLAEQPNKTLFVCRFGIEESSPPVFTNFSPESCETFVDNNTGLRFEVYGVEDGVDISTLEVVIDSKNRRVFVRPKVRRVQ